MARTVKVRRGDPRAHGWAGRTLAIDGGSSARSPATRSGASRASPGVVELRGRRGGGRAGLGGGLWGGGGRRHRAPTRCRARRRSRRRGRHHGTRSRGGGACDAHGPGGGHRDDGRWALPGPACRSDPVRAACALRAVRAGRPVRGGPSALGAAGLPRRGSGQDAFRRDHVVVGDGRRGSGVGRRAHVRADQPAERRGDDDHGHWQPSTHCSEHAEGLRAPKRMHPSRRAGGALDRSLKRVYLPIRPRCVTRTSMTTPARSRRSNLGNRTTRRPLRTNRTTRRTGHGRPMQATSTRAPRFAWPLRICTRTAPFWITPRRRTIGNGLSNSALRARDTDAGCVTENGATPAVPVSVPVSVGVGVGVAGSATWTVSKAVEDTPRSSVALRATRWLPGWRNTRAAVSPTPSSKRPSPLRSQRSCWMVPSESVDADVNRTASPARGAAGLNENAATGGALATTTTCPVATDVAPRSSVTWRPTATLPADVYVHCWVAAVLSSNAPSPSRSHACAAICPSASVDVDAKVTAAPARTVGGSIVNDATGATSGSVTVTVSVCSTVSPPAVTLRVTWRGPVAPNVAVVAMTSFAPTRESPPLKLHWRVSGSLSGSLDVDVNVTSSPGRGLAGLTVNEAVGGAAAASDGV